MRIYSNTLKATDLHRATIGIPICLDRVITILRPKLRKNGYRVRALGYGARQTNTGTQGASGESAASWDVHGQFFARLFEADPCALVVGSVRYDGRAEFHVKTKDKSRLPDCPCGSEHDAGIGAFYDDPKRVEKGD